VSGRVHGLRSDVRHGGLLKGGFRWAVCLVAGAGPSTSGKSFDGILGKEEEFQKGGIRPYPRGRWGLGIGGGETRGLSNVTLRVWGWEQGLML